jgi:hypothetical protein
MAKKIPDLRESLDKFKNLSHWIETISVYFPCIVLVILLLVGFFTLGA